MHVISKSSDGARYHISKNERPRKNRPFDRLGFESPCGKFRHLISTEDPNHHVKEHRHSLCRESRFEFKIESCASRGTHDLRIRFTYYSYVLQMHVYSTKKSSVMSTPSRQSLPTTKTVFPVDMSPRRAQKTSYARIRQCCEHELPMTLCADGGLILLKGNVYHC